VYFLALISDGGVAVVLKKNKNRFHFTSLDGAKSIILPYCVYFLALISDGGVAENVSA
jgi:hypothetical protein